LQRHAAADGYGRASGPASAGRLAAFCVWP
jgi:hypothetical protein